MSKTLNNHIALFALLLALMNCVHDTVCDGINFKFNSTSNRTLNRPSVRLDADSNEDVAGFFDMEMGKDRSLKTFYYNGGYLSIYEGRNEKLKRYYVTPLTEMNSESAKCFEPGIEGRYKVRFNVEVWRSEVADEAVKALASPPLNLEVRKEHVHPLPILKVRLSTHGLSHVYEPETVWKSNLNQRLQHTFSIYAANKDACEQMVTEVKEDPAGFASLIQIEIAMSAEKRASREISITGENIGRSKMFAQLQNMDQKDGERFLSSRDLNQLAQEIVSSVVASEITKVRRLGAYVEKPDQLNFARLLEHQLSSGTINTKHLNVDQWKSVFWQEEFVRPDHYTKYLSNALTYDQGTKKFSFDNETESAARKHVASDLKRDSSNSHSWSAQASASFLGFGGSAGGGSSNTNAQSSQDKNEMEIDNKGRAAMSLDQLNKFLNKRGLQVEWNGDVFVPKSLDLHRVNTAELRYKSTIATQQIQVQTVPITVKLDATVTSSGEAESVGREHIKVLIDQVKNEMNETLKQFTQSLKGANERITGQISNQTIAQIQNEQQFREIKLQYDGEIHKISLRFQETEKQLQQTKQELLQKDTVLERSLSDRTAEIGQIRSTVNSLQQPKTAHCQTYYTGCNDDGDGNARFLDRHNVRCPERAQYMTEWALERCALETPIEHFKRQSLRYRFRAVCCNA